MMGILVARQPPQLVAAPTSCRGARRGARRNVGRGRSGAARERGPLHPSLRHLHDVDDLGSSGVSFIEALGRWCAPPGTLRRHRDNTATELRFRVRAWRVSRLAFPSGSPWRSCRRGAVARGASDAAAGPDRLALSNPHSLPLLLHNRLHGTRLLGNTSPANEHSEDTQEL